MSAELINFNLPKNKSSIIKVIGVGGGGSNAVNYMFSQGIEGVDFIVCNTDNQALALSPVPNKIQLGIKLTEGLGAGSKPETGKMAALETIDQLKDLLSTGTKMVFITAGMGGGTGTGAAPIIAQTAKELGILTVGIVTLPFVFEGRMRKKHAEEGIKELKDSVDTLLVICNDRLREMYGNLSITGAFSKADDVLATAAKGIAEIVTTPGFVNVDFKDIETVMTNGGGAIMGYATASGENRALNAIEEALNSPLLNDGSIRGARQILVNISTSKGEFEASMDEIAEITDYIFEQAGDPDNIIPGFVIDETLGDALSVIVIATHLETTEPFTQEHIVKKVHTLEVEEVKAIATPIVEEVKAPEVKAATVATPSIAASAPAQQSSYAQQPIAKTATTTVYPPTNVEAKAEDEMFVFRRNSVVEPSSASINASTSERKAELFNSTGRPLMVGKTVIFNEEPTHAEVKKPVFEVKDDAKKAETIFTFTSDVKTQEDNIKLDESRKKRLKEMSNKALNLSNTEELREFESIPAFKRKNVSLDDVPHSSETNISRYTLSDGPDNRIELKDNNSFLHDNVD